MWCFNLHSILSGKLVAHEWGVEWELPKLSSWQVREETARASVLSIPVGGGSWWAAPARLCFPNLCGLCSPSVPAKPSIFLCPFSFALPSSQHLPLLRHPLSHGPGKPWSLMFPPASQPLVVEEWTLFRRAEGRRIKWARCGTLRMLRNGDSRGAWVA